MMHGNLCCLCLLLRLRFLINHTLKRKVFMTSIFSSSLFDTHAPESKPTPDCSSSFIYFFFNALERRKKKAHRGVPKGFWQRENGNFRGEKAKLAN